MTIVEDRGLADFADEVGESDAVAVEGSRTRWNLGGELVAGTRVLRAPVGILAYQPEEMTVRVRAGTTVAELHAELGGRGQRTALPRRGGTIGGAVAVGENDLSVLGRGRVRDAVLQVRYVSAEGKVIKGGGPTVKNVSGFDLPRLIVGSLGTLGLIAEVILRTNPIPTASLWLESSDVDPFRVASTLLKPSAILWDGDRTWVEVEGHVADVRDQQRALETVGSWRDVSGPPALPRYRWSLPPRALKSAVGSIEGAFVASIAVGTLFAESPQPPQTSSTAISELTRRIKGEFDPTGRLNPGRSPVRRF